MKKLIPGLALAALVCSPVYADSSTKVLTPGSVTQVTTTDCLILSSSVSIGLSANVQGAVYCRQADVADPSTIMVGACHTGGLTKTRDVTCSRTGTGAAEDPYVYSPTSCSASNFPADADPTTVSYTGPSMFKADTSTGGGIAERDIDGVCNGANVLAELEAIAAQ